MFTEKTLKLTHRAVLAMLDAAATKGEEIGAPQCIVIVDVSGETLGTLRMSGAKYLSLKSARAKARTAANIAGPTQGIPEDFGPLIAAATGGDVTRLTGGLPIVVDGHLVGGVGVGSGTPDQDTEVAEAALAALAKG